MFLRIPATVCLVPLALILAACGGGSRDEPPATPQSSEIQSADETFDQDTVLAEAEGVFGEGAEGIAKVIEKAFSDYGRPNAYIVGEEAGGGIVLGLRYGSGTLHHKLEGKRPVHWTGPSVGFDFGGNAAKVFTLVYNLYDTEDLFRRYPAVEGQLYYIGGFGLNYHRRGDIVIAPIRLGVGLRATANVGYVKYSEERNFNPF